MVILRDNVVLVIAAATVVDVLVVEPADELVVAGAADDEGVVDGMVKLLISPRTVMSDASSPESPFV